MRHARGHVAEAAAEGIDLTVVVAGSERGCSRAIVDPGGPIHYVEHPNRPLGPKFNAAVRGARALDPEYVCICGSGCFFRPSLWAEAREFMDNSVPYFGPEGLYMWDSEDDRGVYWDGYHSGRAIGSGRFLHKSLLDGVAWAPYAEDRDSELDATADSVLPAPSLYSAKSHLFTSVKTRESLNGINHFKAGLQSAHSEPFCELLAQF